MHTVVISEHATGWRWAVLYNGSPVCSSSEFPDDDSYDNSEAAMADAERALTRREWLDQK